MRYLLGFLLIALAAIGCESSKTSMGAASDSSGEVMDTLRIANDSLEYEIIILELGFNNWLVTQPPRGYYGKNFLEGRNRLFVTEYNRRVRNFQIYDPNLYQQEINYEFDIDYGYEVNYLLYNYFKFFQQKYNQSFIGGRRGPRQ